MLKQWCYYSIERGRLGCVDEVCFSSIWFWVHFGQVCSTIALSYIKALWVNIAGRNWKKSTVCIYVFVWVCLHFSCAHWFVSSSSTVSFASRPPQKYVQTSWCSFLFHVLSLTGSNMEKNFIGCSSQHQPLHSIYWVHFFMPSALMKLLKLPCSLQDC